MFEKQPKFVIRGVIAAGMATTALVGVCDPVDAAPLASNNHNTYITAMSLENIIDSTPTQLHQIIASHPKSFRCPVDRKDTGMSQPVCEAIVVNKDGSKIVLNYTHEKGQDSVTDFSIYTVTKTNASTGEFELMGLYIDDNGTTIAAIDDGSKVLHYLNLDSATQSEKDLTKMARYSKSLLDSLT